MSDVDVCPTPPVVAKQAAAFDIQAPSTYKFVGLVNALESKVY
jgi:hypothetical protein